MRERPSFVGGGGTASSLPLSCCWEVHAEIVEKASEAEREWRGERRATRHSQPPPHHPTRAALCSPLSALLASLSSLSSLLSISLSLSPPWRSAA